MANDKHLYELDELTTPQSNDLVMVEQASNNKDMKVKMGNFMPADSIASAVNTYLDGHSGYYVIPDGNVTMDKLATDVHQKFDTKAETDGYYEDMSVGSAEQLLSNTYIPDTDPYLFRTTAGSKEVGDRVYEDAIVGGSVAWNQLVQNGNFADTSAWTYPPSNVSFSVQNNIGIVTIVNSHTANRIQQNINITANRTYLLRVSVKLSRNSSLTVSTDGNDTLFNTSIDANSKYSFQKIVKSTKSKDES